jgi:arylsulfatase A-like enzyme
MLKTTLYTLLCLCTISIFAQRKAPFKNKADTPTANAASARPNIVWIVCEDMSPHLSAFGEKMIQTPNLDQLAEDGIRYTNAYAVAGVCAPSRSGIITGMYPTSIGTNNMRTTTGPRGGGEIDKIPAPYSAVLPAEVKGFPEYLRLNGYYCSNNSKQDYQFKAPVTMWDESSKKAHWRNRPANTPFFAVFNLEITHESNLWTRENESLLADPQKVVVPPYYPDVPEVRHDIARHLSNVVRMDQQAGELIAQLKKDGLYDNTIIFFYSDHGDGLPFVKREVLHRGLHVPLIIKLPKAVKAGTVDNSLISNIDFAPTVLTLANIPVPAHMHGKAFLDNKGLPQKTTRAYIFAGRDRMDTEYDRVRTVMDTNFQYIRNYMPERSYYQDITYRLSTRSMKRMIAMRDSNLLQGPQKLWFRPGKPKEELYDLKIDPYEFNNLASDPKYRAKLQEMRKVYDEWYAAYGDLSELPEKEMLKKMWGGAAKQPATTNPVIRKTTNGVTISCATKGASIGYKINAKPDVGDKDWKVYGGGPLALQPGDVLSVRAERIGFKPSVLTYTPTN